MPVLRRRRFLALFGLMTVAIPGLARAQGAGSSDSTGPKFDPNAPQDLPEGIPSNPDENVVVDIGSWRVSSIANYANAFIPEDKVITRAFSVGEEVASHGGSAELKLGYWSTDKRYEGALTASVRSDAPGTEYPARVLADGVEIDSFIAKRADASGPFENVRDALTLFGDDLSRLTTIGTLQMVMTIDGEEHVVYEVALADTAAALENMRLIPDYNYNVRGIGREPVGATSPSDPNAPVDSNCFLTTACCELVGLTDDCFELRALRRFRDQVLARTPEGRRDIALYYERAPQILRMMAVRDETRHLLPLYFTHILPSAVLAHLGLRRLPDRLYRDLMGRLTRRYLVIG